MAFDKHIREQFFKPEYFVTKTTGTLAADINKFEEQLQQMKRQNYNAGEISQFIENGKMELQAKLYASNQRIKADAEQRLSEIGEKWQATNDKDAAKALLERQRWADRFALLDDGGLLTVANEYITNPPGPESPDKLEVLAMELKSREDTRETGNVLFNRMRENRYNEPWRYTEEGDHVVRIIQEHDTPYGEIYVCPDGENLMPVEIDNLINDNG